MSFSYVLLTPRIMPHSSCSNLAALKQRFLRSKGIDLSLDLIFIILSFRDSRVIESCRLICLSLYLRACARACLSTQLGASRSQSL
jgi:hypothetical protein